MQPRFFVDVMLGKLARWLVLLGYDCKFAGCTGRSDLDLMTEAQSEGRIFVTCDRRIPEVAGVRKVVILHQDHEAQLRQLAGELSLKPDPALRFSRCTDCNEPLEALRCRLCGKVYWSGTHTDGIAATFRRLGL